MARLTVGPALADLDAGPLIRASQLQRVQHYLNEARARRDCSRVRGTRRRRRTGRRLLPGAHAVARRAAIAPDRAEEIFGPVLAALPFDTEDEALAIANGTRYGLVAGVWTRDGARQLRVARKLRCGQVFINNYGAGGGIELPFGGVKSSGYGREKGFEALLGFTTLKTIAIKHG
jgi:aldehyde dehydrogenase (NAD+)